MISGFQKPLAAFLLLLPAAIVFANEPSKEVRLEGVTFEALKARIAANPTKAKYTLVDAWATFCPPCKENFPHLVEMQKKFGDKGLAVISVALDDSKNEKGLKEALAFLKEKGATFPNYYILGENSAGFDGFDISAIPAVFLYGPDGKEIKRFTLDDVDKQFTYEQVEAAVKALLDGKPLPDDNLKSKPKS